MKKDRYSEEKYRNSKTSNAVTFMQKYRYSEGKYRNSKITNTVTFMEKYRYSEEKKYRGVRIQMQQLAN